MREREVEGSVDWFFPSPAECDSQKIPASLYAGLLLWRVVAVVAVAVVVTVAVAAVEALRGLDYFLTF